MRREKRRQSYCVLRGLSGARFSAAEHGRLQRAFVTRGMSAVYAAVA